MNARTMRMTLLGAVFGVLLLLPGGGVHAADAPSSKVKVGFITTLSGPQAVMGTQMKDSADLALEMLGGTLGGIPAEIVYGDDQQKPDVGRQLADRMLKRDNVDFVSGLLASNILLAVYQDLNRAKTIMVSANAGPHEVAGKMCSPYFFSLASQNDQSPQAMGEFLNTSGITDVYIMAPNYAAGHDMVTGFKRSFKGTISGEVFTTFGQSDYQAELSQVRAAHPKAIFAFYPGGMGIQFVKQFAASGLHSIIPLYSVYTQDATNLVQTKSAAVGDYDVSYWNADMENPRNREYIAAFSKKYGYTPSNYGAASFDAMFLIDSAVRAVGGDLTNKKGLIDAMQKADFASVRGPFTYNTNHFPIQNFFLLQVVQPKPGEFSIKTDRVIAANDADRYAAECQMKAP